jgi:hypothetical protein
MELNETKLVQIKVTAITLKYSGFNLTDADEHKIKYREIMASDILKLKRGDEILAYDPKTCISKPDEYEKLTICAKSDNVIFAELSVIRDFSVIDTKMFQFTL